MSNNKDSDAVEAMRRPESLTNNPWVTAARTTRDLNQAIQWRESRHAERTQAAKTSNRPSSGASNGGGYGSSGAKISHGYLAGTSQGGGKSGGSTSSVPRSAVFPWVVLASVLAVIGFFAYQKWTSDTRESDRSKVQPSAPRYAVSDSEKIAKAAREKAEREIDNEVVLLTKRLRDQGASWQTIWEETLKFYREHPNK